MTRYVVTKRLKVGDRVLQPGDEVPEAAGWTNRKAYVAGGHITEVPEAEGGPQVERIKQLEEEVAALREQMEAVVAQVAEQGEDTPPADDADTAKDSKKPKKD